MKTEYKTVEFRPYGQPRKGFSEDECGWDVHRNKGGQFIGGISWCEEWNFSVISTVLSFSVLRDIAAFMDQLKEAPDVK